MKHFKSGFTLIELLVVVAVIGILSSVIFVVLNSATNKGKIAAAQATASSILRGMGVCSHETNGGINVPENVSLGGGVICNVGLNVSTWPPLNKTGYIYNVGADNNITDGVYSFTLTKPGNPTITANLATESVTIAMPEIPPPPPEEGFFTAVLMDAGGNPEAVLEIIVKILGFSLEEAKYLIENVPIILKEGMKSTEAEELGKIIEEAGGGIKFIKEEAIDLFTVILVDAGDKKEAVLEIIVKILYFSPEEAKYLIENVPVVLKEGMKSTEAEELKIVIEEVGGKVELK